MQPLANRVARRPRRHAPGRLALLLAACIGAPAGAFDWQVDISPPGDLFPVLELSRVPRAAGAAIGDGNGLVTVRVAGRDLPATLRVRIETPGLLAPAVLDAQPRPADTTLLLHPRLRWDIDGLRGLAATRRQVMQVTLETGAASETRRFEVRLHALEDVPYYVREGRDHVDLGWAFAAYVDPRDAVVDAVLRLAREIDPRFDEGDSDADNGDPAARDLRRAAAVWAALQQHGLRYDEGDPALSHGPAVYSQRVRLPGEVWRERRANCIDGSVLIASVLERLGMRTFLVLVPQHAFVGFRAGTDSRRYYVETTLLGARVHTAGQSASAGFADAQRAGRARWRSVAARFAGHHGPDYALIDIGTARAYGIIPLAAGERASENPSEILPAPAGTSRKSGSP
jgi:hypothetical protein